MPKDHRTYPTFVPRDSREMLDRLKLIDGSIHSGNTNVSTLTELSALFDSMLKII